MFSEKVEVEKPKLILGYWKIRGLASNIRYQLVYQGIEFEEETYEQGDAPEFDKSSWFKKKFLLGLSFPNLPYLKDDGVCLTETLAIHYYLADKYTPELLGKDPHTRSKVQMLAGVVENLKNK